MFANIEAALEVEKGAKMRGITDDQSLGTVVIRNSSGTLDLGGGKYSLQSLDNGRNKNEPKVVLYQLSLAKLYNPEALLSYVVD